MAASAAGNAQAGRAGRSSAGSGSPGRRGTQPGRCGTSGGGASVGWVRGGRRTRLTAADPELGGSPYPQHRRGPSLPPSPDPEDQRVPETVVHLVRHGQVENPRRVLYGRLPGYHLSRRGQAQADLLAGHFAGTPLAAVVASPLERAQQTAAPIAGAHGLEVRTDLRLIETSNIFEGAAGNIAWYILRHPKLWWKLRDLRAPSWGERNVDMAERVHAAVDAARAEFAGQQVVLVSHQAPIWVAR